MKQKIKALFSCLICIVILCISLFACSDSSERIDADQVEKVMLGDYVFSDREAEEFIELFNSASFVDEEDDIGTTPDYFVFVEFSDGSYLCIKEINFIGREFEVSLNDANGNTMDLYYANSEELEDFMLNMVDKLS